MPAKASEQFDVSLSDRTQTITQVAELIKQTTQLEIPHSGAEGFKSTGPKGDNHAGIQSAEGWLGENSILNIRLQILNPEQDARVSAKSLFAGLSQLGEKTRLTDFDGDSSNRSVWIELQIQPFPLSYTRSTALLKELKKINNLAISIQESVNNPGVRKDLATLYHEVSDIIAPVDSWNCKSEVSSHLSACLHDVHDLINSSCSVLLLARNSIELDYSVARLAWLFEQNGASLGQAIYPGLSLRAIVEIVKRAPGKVVIPVASLRLAVSPFEMEFGFSAFMDIIVSRRESTIFVGYSSGDEDLLKLAGSTGNDSHLVLREIAGVPFEDLTHFAVTSVSNTMGGLLKSEIDTLAEQIIRAIDLIDPSAKGNILPNLITKTVRCVQQGKAIDFNSICTDTSRILELKRGGRKNES